MTAPESQRGRAAREFVAGAWCAWRGLRVWGTSRRLMLWGLLPGVVTAIIFGAGAFALVTQVARIGGAIADAVAPSDGWFHQAVQVIGVLAVLGAAGLVAVYTFTAFTLLIGQPVFERLSRDVDRAHGWDGTDPDESAWRSVVRGVGEALRLAVLTVPLAIGLFLMGLIPVVGAPVAFVTGATVGGWLLALELTSYPLSRRGVVDLKHRRAVLGSHRPRVVGFGAVVFTLFLIPLGALLFMPAAMSGATILVQGVGERPPVLSPARPPGQPE